MRGEIGEEKRRGMSGSGYLSKKAGGGRMGQDLENPVLVPRLQSSYLEISFDTEKNRAQSNHGQNP